MTAISKRIWDSSSVKRLIPSFPFCFSFFLIKKETKKSRLYIKRLKISGVDTRT